MIMGPEKRSKKAFPEYITCEEELMKTEALKERAAKIADKAISVMAVISAVMIISYLVSGLTTGKESVFGYRILWVRSESMEPSIMTGDFVLVKAVRGMDVDIGDIAVYRKTDPSGKTTRFRIIHRIIAVTDEGDFIFKGDNNPLPDIKNVRPEQVEYKVIRVL